MNDLAVREVEFQGFYLLAVQELQSNKIYAGINPILMGLGFDAKQTEYLRDKWVSDKVLAKGTRKFSGTLLEMKTGKDVWCIDINKLPLALAKINITPKIGKEMPELSNRLEQYQDKCADVLAAAFLPQQSSSFEDIMIAQLQEQKRLKESVRVIDTRVDKLENTMTIDYAQQLELRELAKNVVMGAVGGKKSRAYTYQYPKQGIGDKPPKLYGTVISRVWHDYQSYFKVNSYKNTPAIRFNEAREYLNNWKPPINMQLEIGKINREDTQ